MMNLLVKNLRGRIKLLTTFRSWPLEHQFLYFNKRKIHVARAKATLPIWLIRPWYCIWFVSLHVTVFPSHFLHEMAYIVNQFGLTWPWKGHHSKNRNSLCCNFFQWCNNSSHLVMLEEKQSGWWSSGSIYAPYRNSIERSWYGNCYGCFSHVYCPDISSQLIKFDYINYY